MATGLLTPAVPPPSPVVLSQPTVSAPPHPSAPHSAVRHSTPLHSAPLNAAPLHGDSTRSIDQHAWAEIGMLLRAPRDVVTDLHRVHRPQPGTAVVGVLEHDGRVIAGASFPARVGHGDGWQFRNAVIAQLRRIVPHDLRRARPLRTAVLMLCRRGAPEWTEVDGAWMWALRDASSLHGLRCGAYVTLTDSGWQVMGETRAGRHPNAGSWAEQTVHTHVLSSLPPRSTPELQPLRQLESPAEPAVIAVR